MLGDDAPATMQSAVEAALLTSECLADCHGRVQEAGCELKPAFTNGLISFIPLT